MRPWRPGPFPVILYVDGCCQGDYPNPQSVDPWLTHLARQGYVIVAPVYRATTVLADVPARLTRRVGRAGPTRAR